MILNYELYQDFTISRSNQPANMLIFNFQHIINLTKTQTSNKLQPSVQIATQGLNVELFIPKKTIQNSITLSIDADYLRELVGAHINHPLINTVLENKL